MEQIRTNGKLTLIVNYDKESKYYLNEIGEIREGINIDQIFQKLSVYCSGTIIENFTAILESERNKIIQSQNNWINRQNEWQNTNGSTFKTMINNKFGI